MEKLTIKWSLGLFWVKYVHLYPRIEGLVF